MIIMLEKIKDMTGYLGTYGNELADRIKNRAEPIFNPGDPWDDRLYKLLKNPYSVSNFWDRVERVLKVVMGQNKIMRLP